MKKKQLNLGEVKHIANLCKLDLSEMEISKFQKQLSNIIDLFAQLRKVEVSKTTPVSNVTGLCNIFRDDIVTPSLSQEQTLANAHEKYKGYFKVKAIFE